MLDTFLDRLGGLLDKRFIIAYWSPAFIGLGLLTGVVVGIVGPAVIFSWWDKLTGTEQVVLGMVGLLAVTLLAYLLDALTTNVIRLYEGYWPKRLPIGWARKHQQKAAKAASNYYSTFYYSFPRDPALLNLTRLGNVLAAAEEYPYQLYRVNAVIWWPRLTVLMPDNFRSQLDSFLVPIVALLNLSTLLILLAVGCGVALVFLYLDWWLLVPTFIVGLVLARACYLATINQAISYGKLVRVAFDLYRHEILKQMHLSVPDNLVDERLLWDALNTWTYYYIPPWESETATKTLQLAHPFYYEMHKTSLSPNGSLEVTSKNEQSASSPSTEDKNTKKEWTHISQLKKLWGILGL